MESDRIDSPAAPSAPAVAVQREPRLKIVAAYLVCASIWGTTWFAIRACVQPGGYLPLPGAALRFVITVAIFGCMWFALRQRFGRPSLSKARWIALAGCCAGLGYALLYCAEQSVSGGIAAVISASAPLIVAIVAMATKTERPTRMTIVGALLAFPGVAIVFHDRIQVSFNQAAAVATLILNCCVGSVSNVLLKKHANEVPSIVSNTIFFSACCLLLWSGALIGHQAVVPYPLPPVPTIALIYLAIFGTVCTFAAWFYLLKHVRLSTVMTLSFVTPVLALIVDNFFEKQTVLHAETYVGVAFVMAGVAATILLKFRSDK
jgi:drug/metabolite transporter (DMT)-like permease